jgi:hypothetical protein
VGRREAAGRAPRPLAVPYGGRRTDGRRGEMEGEEKTEDIGLR